MSTPHNKQGERRVRRTWMVWRASAFATSYLDPPNTYGPFESKEKAEEFAGEHGHVYDDSALTFGDREVLGVWS